MCFPWNIANALLLLIIQLHKSLAALGNKWAATTTILLNRSLIALWLSHTQVSLKLNPLLQHHHQCDQMFILHQLRILFWKALQHLPEKSTQQLRQGPAFTAAASFGLHVSQGNLSYHFFAACRLGFPNIRWILEVRNCAVILRIWFFNSIFLMPWLMLESLSRNTTVWIGCHFHHHLLCQVGR